MKIAFIGAHGVGKTALAFEQAARFKRESVNVEIVREVARSCPLPINESTTLEAQTWILMQQISEEIVASSRAALVITDRSVLDNYAYLERVKTPSLGLQLWLANWVQTYDLLIKVPIVDAEIQADGVRSTNAGFAATIDDRIDSLIYKFNVPKLRRLSFNRENWNTEAYQLIKELLP